MWGRGARLALVLGVLASLALMGAGRAGAAGFSKVDYGVGLCPLSVVIADFTGDGVPDVAVSDFCSAAVIVLPGAGGGTFGTGIFTPVGDSPHGLAVGDFDRDDVSDIAVVNQGDDTVTVLLGDGDGTFTGPGALATGTTPVAVAVGEFNSDSKQDLAVVDNQDDTVSILTGDGKGAFAAREAVSIQATSGLLSSPNDIAVGELSGDKDDDIVVTAYSAGTVNVLVGARQATFDPVAGYAAGSGPYSVALADFDGDGAVDAAATCYLATGLVTLPGVGDGTLGTALAWSGDGALMGVQSADLDGDGYADLVAAVPGSDRIDIFIGKGDGTFWPPSSVDAGDSPRDVAIGDLDGDAVPDIVAVNATSASVSVLLSGGAAPSGSMTLNAGDIATNQVTVTVSSNVTRAVEMSVRDAGGSWSPWQSYAAETSWTVPTGDGPKWVEVRYRNSSGETLTISDAILLDTVAPVTSDDAPSGWRRTPVTVTLSAADPGGSGILLTQHKVDDAGIWSTGMSVPLSGDGAHTITYRSEDIAGNMAAAGSCSVKIDTSKPLTSGKAVTVKRNKKATFKVKVADRADGSRVETVTISIVNKKGKVVKKLSGFAPVPANVTVSLKWSRCSLAKGAYRYVVYATDEAGNAQSKAGRAKLTVK